MADDLRDRIASAIRETVPLHQGGYKTADAVLAVVGPELERLRAALDGAGQHVGTVIQRAEQAEAERDHYRERLAETDEGAAILALEETVAAADADRDRLEAERDELRDALDHANRAQYQMASEYNRELTVLKNRDRINTAGLALAHRRQAEYAQKAIEHGQRAEQAEAERDALKAAIRAVTSDWATRARSAATWVDEAKTDVEKVRWNVWRTAYECLASELLAALDTPTPTEGTPHE